nr:hypothetical protein [Tanacetum cinerariifolium]
GGVDSSAGALLRPISTGGASLSDGVVGVGLIGWMF